MQMITKKGFPRKRVLWKKTNDRLFRVVVVVVLADGGLSWVWVW